MRKRTWRRGELDPNVEKVKYLFPSAEDHGLWVQAEGGVPRLTKTLMMKTTTPVDDAIWVALERDAVDAVQARRRIREKSAIRRVQGEEDEEEEEEAKRQLRRRTMDIIEEEGKRMLEDDPELAVEEMRILRSMKRFAAPNEEEEILQTRIVSPKEVAKNWSAWIDSVKDEVESLAQEKEALRQLSPDQVKRMVREAEEKGRKVEYIPSKVIFTRKPGKSGGKKKTRWVVCGNYEERKEGEDTFSSGADSTSFRVLYGFRRDASGKVLCWM